METKNHMPGECLVAIQLNIPNILKDVYYPDNNAVGTQLLERCLVHLLRSEGVVVSHSALAFPFNNGFVLLVVPNAIHVAHALRVIVAELDALHIKHAAVVAWSKEGDCTLRTYEPAGGIIQMPSQAEMLASLKTRQSVIDAMQRLLGTLPPPPQQ